MKLTSYPHLVKEWHPTLNGELTPNDLTHGSKKKVWWLCSKGHNFESMPNSRTASRTGCPYCSGKRVSESNNLLVLFPEIAKEWHPTLNGELVPEQFTAGSSHKKVWWLCPKGHSYDSVIGNRTKKKKPTGCPYCSGNKVSEENNLLAVYPEIAIEWHPTMNGDLTPKQVTSKTNTKVWWLCPKGHSYDSRINSRTASLTNCPYCSGRRVGEDNNLLYLFPEIAKEWHPTKNKKLTPKDVTSKSDKKVWWLCPKGHSHESVVKNRTLNKSMCPDCSNQSSEPEIRILSELKWLFDEVNSRYKLDGVEIDVFLPKFNLGIEYDGKYWHKDNEDSDLEKNKFLLSQNINLIRVREQPLKSLSENDVVVRNNRSLEKTDLDEILKMIQPFVDNKTKEIINTYLRKPSFVNDELFKKYRSYFPSPFPEKSILKTHPELSEEWDYDKNYPLRPENFSYGSGNNLWWLCPKGHSYERSLNTRTSHGIGCPYCSGRRVGEDNNLQVVFPEVAIEWHPTKNNELTPKDFTSKSAQKVWWLCPQGHSYDSTIYHRTRKQPTGCPYCSGRRVSEENNLLFLFPEIAKEWHPTKNGKLTPKDFTHGSAKKVWWLCPADHSYEQAISSRAGKQQQGCPYCSGKRVSESNNLLFLFPEVAKEWHPTKNGELTPKQVTFGSHKKVWWLCSKGHSFDSVIKERTRKNPKRCPYCSGKKTLNYDFWK